MLTHPPQVRSVQELVPLVPLGSGSREAISRSGKREGRREIKHLLLYMSFRPVIPVIHERFHCGFSNLIFHDLEVTSRPEIVTFIIYVIMVDLFPCHWNPVIPDEMRVR